MTFLVNGAAEFDEPGVFMSFEETAEDLTQNVASLGFDVDDLVAPEQARHRSRAHRAQRDRGDRRVRPGGLFVRLGYAIDSIGAKRVVLDTIEALFAGLDNTAILRAELRRLFALAEGRRASPPSSPASGATAR